MDAKSATARHLTLVDGSAEARRSRTGLRRLRAVVLREYLDKLPEFLPVADILQICGMRHPELAEAAERGRVRLVKRDGSMGIVVRDNLVFLRAQRLLQLPVPHQVRVRSERAGELVAVSGDAYAELVRRAGQAGTEIAEVIDGLLAR